MFRVLCLAPYDFLNIRTNRRNRSRIVFLLVLSLSSFSESSLILLKNSWFCSFRALTMSAIVSESWDSGPRARRMPRSHLEELRFHLHGPGGGPGHAGEERHLAEEAPRSHRELGAVFFPFILVDNLAFEQTLGRRCSKLSPRSPCLKTTSPGAYSCFFTSLASSLISSSEAISAPGLLSLLVAQQERRIQ